MGINSYAEDFAHLSVQEYVIYFSAAHNISVFMHIIFDGVLRPIQNEEFEWSKVSTVKMRKPYTVWNWMENAIRKHDYLLLSPYNY